MTATHPHHHSHHGDSPAGGLLDLDAQVFGSYLDDTFARIEHHLSAAPRRVVDLGAGTGVGSVALAHRFPSADIVAIDSATDMLERVRSAAQAQGLADRVTTLQADLDAGWPDADPFDLAWASSSLHHLTDPLRVLRQLRSGMEPEGLAVVIETDSQPHFLPEDDTGLRGLENRLHELMDTAGWNAHPDWTPHLEQAGFDLVDKLSITATSTSPDAGRYARLYLSRAHAALGDRLAADDSAALSNLLAEEKNLGPGRVAARSTRTVWICRRPAAGIRPQLPKETSNEH